MRQASVGAGRDSVHGPESVAMVAFSHAHHLQLRSLHIPVVPPELAQSHLDGHLHCCRPAWQDSIKCCPHIAAITLGLSSCFHGKCPLSLIRRWHDRCCCHMPSPLLQPRVSASAVTPSRCNDRAAMCMLRAVLWHHFQTLHEGCGGYKHSQLLHHCQHTA